MFNKILALSVLLTAANTAYLGHGRAVSFQSIVHHNQPRNAHYAAPVAHYNLPVVHYAPPVAHYAASEANYGSHDTYVLPKYNYAYEGSDSNAAQGYYTLVQSNGSFRKEYTANHNGLNAVLRMRNLPLHPAPIYEENDHLY